MDPELTSGQEGGTPAPEPEIQAPTPEASAAPPAAQEEPKSLAEALTKSIGKLGADGEGGASPPAAPPAKPEAGKEPAKPAEPEQDPEDAKLPPFHTHPRWVKLQGEVKELRPLREQVTQYQAKATELETAMKQQEPVVQAYGRMRDYCVENGLDNNDINEAFRVTAAVKNNPEAAIPLLEQYLADLKARAGYVLPQDLADDVDSGRITEDRATELSRARAQQEAAAAANRRLAEQSQQQQAKTADERRLEAGRAARVALQEAEALILTNPDAARVQERVHEGLELWLVRRRDKGIPFPTAQEVVNQAKAFYGTELKRLRELTQHTKPIIARPPTGGSAPSRTQPATATTSEGHMKAAILNLGG